MRSSIGGGRWNSDRAERSDFELKSDALNKVLEHRLSPEMCCPSQLLPNEGFHK